MKSPKDQKPQAPFAYEGLDRVIHERARLSILTSLITHRDGLGFGELKELCALTDGNLARHLQVLEESGMVRVSKDTGPTQAVTSGRALTTVRVTAPGRKRFLEYLAVLEKVVQDAATAEAGTASGSEDEPLSRSLTPLRT